MASSWNSKYRSNWDEPLDTTNNINTISNINTSFQTLQLQLFGIIGVLLIIITLAIPITIVISDIKTSTTVSTTIPISINTTTKTMTTTTTTITNPYACSTMVFLNNTDLVGNDIRPNPVLNYTACCTLCLTTNSCIALTWSTVTRICYPKFSAGSGGTHYGGVYSARY